MFDKKKDKKEKKEVKPKSAVLKEILLQLEMPEADLSQKPVKKKLPKKPRMQEEVE